MKRRLGREVRRPMWCFIWFTDSFLLKRPPFPHTHTHTTWGSAGLGCRLCSSLRDNGRMGYWSARLLSELKLFIMLSALSRDPPSLMDRGMVLPRTCRFHPHTLSTIDPRITRPWSLVPRSLGEHCSSCAVSTEICFSSVSPCWWVSPLSFQEPVSPW